MQFCAHARITPKGTRTPVFWLRTRHPRPLDDGGFQYEFYPVEICCQPDRRGKNAMGGQIVGGAVSMVNLRLSRKVVVRALWLPLFGFKPNWIKARLSISIKLLKNKDLWRFCPCFSAPGHPQCIKWSCQDESILDVTSGWQRSAASGAAARGKEMFPCKVKPKPSSCSIVP